MVLVLRRPEGLHTVPLKPGASGFAEACVGSMLYQSEIANLMFAPPAVKVAKAQVKKRPAAAAAAAAASAAGASKRRKPAAPARQEEEEEEEEEAEEPEAGEEAGSDFGGGPEGEEAGEGDEEELGDQGEAVKVPAVAEEGKGSEALDPAEPAPEAAKQRAYHKMWYCAPRSAWAIRQVAAPKRQIFQVSCSSVQLDQAGLEVLFDEALVALASGAVKEHSCKEWILYRARGAQRP
jgi:hypothetical protein